MTESEKSLTEAMKKDGWTKQFATNEPRLSEAVSIYKEAGFEVALRDMPSVKTNSGNTRCGSGRDCRTCFEGFEHLYKIIFTRPLENHNEEPEVDPF